MNFVQITKITKLMTYDDWEWIFVHSLSFEVVRHDLQKIVNRQFDWK